MVFGYSQKYLASKLEHKSLIQVSKGIYIVLHDQTLLMLKSVLSGQICDWNEYTRSY